MLILLLFTSCGEATVVGKWKQKAMVVEGVRIPQRKLFIEFKADGTYEMSRKSRRSNTVLNKGTWKYDSEAATINLERESGSIEKWTNVRLGAELRVTGRDFDIIFVRSY